MDERTATWLVKLLVVLVVLPDPLRGDQVVLKDITLGFGQALEQCRQQSGLSVDVMEEFFHFWQDDFKFEKRELGCAMLCMSQQFGLLTDSHRMHHEKTDQFIKSFPNGEVLAKQMVTMIHDCERQFEHVEDHCFRILKTAECFKVTCVKAKLAPTMEMILAEIIMESSSE